MAQQDDDAPTPAFVLNMGDVRLLPINDDSDARLIRTEISLATGLNLALAVPRVAQACAVFAAWM